MIDASADSSLWMKEQRDLQRFIAYAGGSSKSFDTCTLHNEAERQRLEEKTQIMQKQRDLEHSHRKISLSV